MINACAFISVFNICFISGLYVQLWRRKKQGVELLENIF
jgi:hypothetical protein